MRVIGFIGGDSQVGTSMTAQAYAELLAERGRKVLLVLCSGKVCSAFLKTREPPSIDDLRANLVSGHLEPGELEQALCRERGVSILPDVRDSLSAPHYPAETARTLLAAAGDYEEAVLDLGDRVDLGLVTSGILAADRCYLVVTQQEKVLERSRFLMERVLKKLEVEPELIVNKYLQQLPLPGSGAIEKILSRPVAARLPYIESGWEMEIRRASLLEEKRYRKGMEGLLKESGERRTGWSISSIWKRI